MSFRERLQRASERGKQIRAAQLNEAAAKALSEIVADATATKTSLPNNYWLAEHEARMKMQIAGEVACAIQDEIDEQR